MAKPPSTPTVAEATFAPFKWFTNTAVALLLLWLVHAGLHVAYTRHMQIEPAGHIQAELDRLIPANDPMGLAHQMANQSANLVLDQFKLQRLIPQSPSAQRLDATTDKNVARAVQRGFWAAFKWEITVLIYASILFAAKLGVMLTLIPLFIIWMLAFGVDGLVQRSIRRACGGYESATIYHRAKLYGFKLVLPFAAVVYLCTPVGFHPAYLFIPVALFSGYLIRLQATYYKKYL